MYNCRIRRRFFLLIGFLLGVIGSSIFAGCSKITCKSGWRCRPLHANVDCDCFDSGTESVFSSPERDTDPNVFLEEEKNKNKIQDPITAQSFEKEEEAPGHKELVRMLSPWLAPNTPVFYDDCHSPEYHISCSIQVDKYEPETLARFPENLHWDELKMNGAGTQEQLTANLQAFIRAMGGTTVRVLEFSEWTVVPAQEDEGSDTALSDPAPTDSARSELISVNEFSDVLPEMEIHGKNIRVDGMRINSLSHEALRIIIPACAGFQFGSVYFATPSPYLVPALDLLRCGEVGKVWIVVISSIEKKPEKKEFFARIPDTPNEFWSAKEIQLDPRSWEDDCLSFLLHRITGTLAMPIDLYASIIISARTFKIPRSIVEVRLYEVSESTWEILEGMEDELENPRDLWDLTSICLDLSFLSKRGIGKFNVETALHKLLAFCLHYHRGLFVVRVSGLKNLERPGSISVVKTLSKYVGMSLEERLNIPVIFLKRMVKKVANGNEDVAEILVGCY